MFLFHLTNTLWIIWYFSGCYCSRNIALQQRAESSPVLNNFESRWSPDKAVDGDPNQNVYCDSCLHTQEQVGRPAFLKIVFQNLSSVNRVEIFYRRPFLGTTCGGTAANNSIHNDRFKAYRINLDDNTCYQDTSEPYPALYENNSCQGTGNNMTIVQNRGTTQGQNTYGPILEICEVKVHEEFIINRRIVRSTDETVSQLASCSKHAAIALKGCPAGTYGNGCLEECPENCLHETCDPDSGVCWNGCESGWIGNKCEDKCPEQAFGLNCTGICRCYNSNNCHHINGSCPNGLCDSGWRGESCQEVCHDYYYGHNCTQRCHNCKNNVTCHHVNGTCPDGCMDGYTGDKCDTECPIGSYGPDCSLECGNCFKDSCRNTNGLCQQGCDKGYKGDYCKTACEGGMYSYNCNTTCGNCRNSAICDRESGNCPGNDCEDGFKGPNCKDGCGTGEYGQNCRETCGSCKDEVTCNSVNGTCTNGCKDGFLWDDCKRECPVGLYGPNCSLICQHCYNESCRHTDGVCEHGCERGYRGSICDQECPAYFYGASCTHQCGNCKNNVTCDHTNGSCPDGCSDGYTSNKCDKVCSFGFYGSNCSFHCGFCFENACRPTDGECQLGCERGFYGQFCDQECENGTYSYDCKSACGMCRNNATCDKETGVCPGHLCDEGYFGAYCIEALLDVLGNPREYTARLGMFFACFVSFLTAAVTSGRQNDQKRKTLLRVHKAAKMRGLKTTLFKDRLYINGKLYRCDINRCSFTGHGFSSTFSAGHTPSICWDLPVDSFSHISQIDADDLRIPEDTGFPDSFLSSYDVTSSVDDAFWSAMDQ